MGAKNSYGMKSKRHSRIYLGFVRSSWILWIPGSPQPTKGSASSNF